MFKMFFVIAPAMAVTIIPDTSIYPTAAIMDSDDLLQLWDAGV